MDLRFVSFFMVSSILVAANICAAVEIRDLDEDVAIAKSAMSNFTADTFIFEQILGKFLPVVDDHISDIVLQIQDLLADLGVSQDLLNAVSDTVTNANSTIHNEISSVVVPLHDLEGHVMVINNNLLNNLLNNIETDLSTMNQMTQFVQAKYTSAIGIIQTAISLVNAAIQNALEGQSGPEVAQITTLIDEAAAELYAEKTNIELAKSFYDGSRVIAEDALTAVVEALNPSLYITKYKSHGKANIQ